MHGAGVAGGGVWGEVGLKGKKDGCGFGCIL